MAEKITYINAAQYEDEVLRGEKVVVDFYSTECPPCEALASKFEGLSELYGDDITFIKIFRQENRELAESLGITSSPTVLFYDMSMTKEEWQDISQGLEEPQAAGRERPEL